MIPWFNEKGAYPVTVNLDPGVSSLPYTPDVDVRDYVDIKVIMENYELGPNGALMLAADMVATKLGEIQDEIESLNPDYAIIDTPGQIELFAYRASGPYVVSSLRCEGKAIIFLFDSTLVGTPLNFVSLALLASSLRLRLPAAQIPVLSKKDLVGNMWREIIRWSSDAMRLEEAISREAGGEEYILSKGILRVLVKAGFAYELIPHSSATMEGMVELSATLTRIFKGGEEVEA